jgi:hypothetical protein
LTPQAQRLLPGDTLTSIRGWMSAKKGKPVKMTKKDAKKAKKIMVDESSTFSVEPGIQYPEIQYAPRDGSTANQLDLPQMTRLEHQFTVHFKSPTMPSKVIIEF